MPRHDRSRPVINITTGEHYPSIKAAAEAIERRPASLWKALRFGNRSGGFLWCYTDDDQFGNVARWTRAHRLESTALELFKGHAPHLTSAQWATQTTGPGCAVDSSCLVAESAHDPNGLILAILVDTRNYR
eukprot:g54211.t1